MPRRGGERRPSGAADHAHERVGPFGIAVAAVLGFGFGFGSGCATSDQVLDGSAKRQLEEIESAPKSKAECMPGKTGQCYSGPEGTAGRGICKPGKRTCDPDGIWQDCQEEALPKRELCNRHDDDCDGIVDNGFERDGAICFRGKGACKSRGAWKCSKDGAKSECDAAIIKPAEERCDGVDNDCDGEVDEGDVPGTGQNCSTGKPGVCNAGTKRCIKGAIRCAQNIQPSIEICNKQDDNCNNDVDEECLSAEEARKQGLLK